MTQEEKARAYDGALKLAKDYYEDKNYPGYLKGVLENIFPELAESEYEKVRKRIIQAFRDDILDMEETNKALAQLEKQNQVKEP